MRVMLSNDDHSPGTETRIGPTKSCLPAETERSGRKGLRYWPYQLAAIFAHMTAAAIVLGVWAARAANSVVVGIVCFAVAWAISAHIAWKLRGLFD